MQEKVNSLENNGKQVDEIVQGIIGTTTVELDNYLTTVRNCFANQQEIPDADLQRIMLEIPKCTYSLIVLAQQIEARKGLAKEQATYAKNEALLKAVGTVQQKEAWAENETARDRMIQIAYTTAASIISKKIDGAMALVDSAKRVLASRDKEKALTGLAGSTVGAF